MGPKNLQDLFEKSLSKNYFTFTVVRHPFDRLISAYRDRILHGCTGQSMRFVPKIFSFTKNQPFLWFWIFLGTSGLFEENSKCIKVMPTFQEFIQFVSAKPEIHDPHWMTYNKVRKSSI